MTAGTLASAVEASAMEDAMPRDTDRDGTKPWGDRPFLTVADVAAIWSGVRGREVSVRTVHSYVRHSALALAGDPRSRFLDKEPMPMPRYVVEARGGTSTPHGDRPAVGDRPDAPYWLPEEADALAEWYRLRMNDPADRRRRQWRNRG